jgi:hypothetical protein
MWVSRTSPTVAAMKTISSLVASARTRLKPTKWWVRHFRRDLNRDWTIPWAHGIRLPATARTRIADSIAEFQRGESSEARVYLAKSERFSAHAGDPDFHQASLLFVAAENMHADLLLKFMRQHEIPPRGSSPVDGVFRWLRGLSDLGWTSRVILIAELVAQEYYPCLRDATDDPALRRICQRVIAEEAAHIHFQVERIVRVEAAHSSGVTWLRDWLQGGLLAGTVMVVFFGHRRVLSARLSWREWIANLRSRHVRAVATMRRWRADGLQRAFEQLPIKNTTSVAAL